MCMESAILGYLPLDFLERLLTLPFGEGWLALAFFALTASVYATGIPGTLLPISFSSGLLLGGVAGVSAVAAGAMLGSLTLYYVLERGSQATLKRRFARHLDRLEGVVARGGLFPIIGLRLAGLPHLAVTGLCAFAAVGPRRYAIATAIGVLPAIALSAFAGAAV